MLEPAKRTANESGFTDLASPSLNYPLSYSSVRFYWRKRTQLQLVGFESPHQPELNVAGESIADVLLSLFQQLYATFLSNVSFTCQSF